MSPKIKLYDKLPWTQGLVLDLPLYLSQMGSAGKVLDRTRYHNNGIVTGALWTPQGRTFDGIDNKIVVPYHASFPVGSADRSCVIWATFSATARRTLIYYGEAAGSKDFFLGQDPTSGQIAFLIWGYNNLSGVTATLDQFYCIGVSMISGTSYLYINGEFKNSAAYVANTGTGDIWIGEDYLGYYHRGIIGAVALRNWGLSAGGHMNYYLATKWRFS